MGRKIIEDMTCPFCCTRIKYWPNYSPNTSSDYGNVGWSKTKGGLKQFFHNSCFRANTRGAMKEVQND